MFYCFKPKPNYIQFYTASALSSTCLTHSFLPSTLRLQGFSQGTFAHDCPALMAHLVNSLLPVETQPRYQLCHTDPPWRNELFSFLCVTLPCTCVYNSSCNIYFNIFVNMCMSLPINCQFPKLNDCCLTHLEFLEHNKILGLQLET